MGGMRENHKAHSMPNGKTYPHHLEYTTDKWAGVANPKSKKRDPRSSLSAREKEGTRLPEALPSFNLISFCYNGGGGFSRLGSVSLGFPTWRCPPRRRPRHRYHRLPRRHSSRHAVQTHA